MARCARVWVVGVVLVVLIAGNSLAKVAPQGTAASNGSVSSQKVLTDYCLECHNDRLKTAGVSFEAINIERAGNNAELWEQVSRKLRGRTMPPLGRKRPDDNTYNTIVAYLESPLDSSAASNPNPGRVATFRRLN